MSPIYRFVTHFLAYKKRGFYREMGIRTEYGIRRTGYRGKGTDVGVRGRVP